MGISPDRPQSQQLYLTSYLAYETALGNPAGQTASMLRSMSPELLSAVLTEALKVGQPGRPSESSMLWLISTVNWLSRWPVECSHRSRTH